MDMQNITKITLAGELSEQGLLQGAIAKRLEVNRDTIRLWLKGIREYGLVSFLDRYTNAKKGERKRRQVDPVMKRWVWDIREREMDCCGEKIRYFLQKEHRVTLASSKIYEILHEKYQLRSKWKKNQKRGDTPEASRAREVIQMDSIDFGAVFAFTGIDIYTREADIYLAPELTAVYGYEFLKQSMQRRFNHHVETIQTDGGSEFEKEFTEHVLEYTEKHRIARPYKKNEQSYIESFNRTVRKECLGWIKYKPYQMSHCKQMVESFLERYHYHRPHMGIGMQTPLTRV